MKSLYVFALLSLTLLPGCQKVSVPTNNEASSAVRDWVTDRMVEIATNGNKFAGTFSSQEDANRAAAQAADRAKAQGVSIPVEVTEMGSQGTADLQAPGSKDSYWPVHVKAVTSDEILTGTMLVYRDNFHKWKAKPENEGLRSQPVYKEPPEVSEGRLNADLKNAKQIHTSCKLYAIDYSGHFPKDLNELVPDYLPDWRKYVAPNVIDYDYFGAGATENDDPNKILLRAHYKSPDGRFVVVQIGGRASIERQ